MRQRQARGVDRDHLARLVPTVSPAGSGSAWNRRRVDPPVTRQPRARSHVRGSSLRLLAFIVVIASTVQFVEMAIKKLSPALFRALGIFLPLITINCAIPGLALFQTNRGYGFVESVVFAAGAGVGRTVALVLMAGIREEDGLVTPPEALNSAAMSFLVAGILSIAFMGFSGLISAA